MFVQVYGAAFVIIVSSVIVGRAICDVTGNVQRWWAAPAVGLGAIIVVTGAAIKLPGHATTAVAAGALVLVVSIVFLAWRRLLAIRSGDLVVGGLALLGASLPFIAGGHVGLQGVSWDNDTAHHLLYAETLRSSRMAMLWGVQNGYPLGPHSLVATIGTAIGAPLDLIFAGLLVAVVPITALVAQGVVAGQALWRRALVALVSSLVYLVAAYYGEGAFKETIMAALLLAFVLHLEQVQARWSEAGAVGRWRLMVPAVLLVAGAVYTYSYAALPWFGLTLAIWAVAEAVRQPTSVFAWSSRRRLATSARWLAATAALAIVILLPVAGQAAAFFRSLGVSPAASGLISASTLGNLGHPLSAYEMLGIWWSPDFRTLPADVFHAGELSAFALAVLVYGVLWSLRRRRLLMPAAVAASVLIWWRSDRSQSPYLTAKALVIASPVIVALGARALLTRQPERSNSGAIRLAVGVLFCGFALYSSYQLLRNAPVQPPEAGRELAAFASRIGNSPVLFLGDDDYAPWQLHPAAVTALAGDTHALSLATARPSKPAAVEGNPVDFDSVVPADIDHFTYAITTNTPYASQVPANFRLLARSRLYELWQRTAATVPRQILESPSAPGGVLDCGSPLGKKLRREHGEASVMQTPVVVGGGVLAPGGSVSLPLPLSRGEWELSIQYNSTVDLILTAGATRGTMPAYLGRVGPFFAVGQVTGHGASSPVTVTVRADRPSAFTSPSQAARFPLIAATRIPDSRRMVPLNRACGQYVDWYRLSS